MNFFRSLYVTASGQHVGSSQSNLQAASSMQSNSSNTSNHNSPSEPSLQPYKTTLDEVPTETTDVKVLSRASDAARDHQAKVEAARDSCSEATRRNHVVESETNDDQLLQGLKDNARSHILHKKHERKRLEGGIMVLEEELEDIRRKTEARQNTIDLFNARQRELEKARRIIVNSDIHAPASIKKGIHSLNRKIENIALGAKSFQLSRIDVRGEPGMIRDFLELEYIPFPVPQGSPTEGQGDILQSILQIYLCRNVNQVLCSWNCGEFGQFLDQNLYYHIARTEEPNVAAKWREMVCRELQTDHVALDNHALSISTSLIQILSSVGLVGTNLEVEQITSDIRDLVHKSEKIGKLMKTGMTTCDIRPVIVAHGQPFNRLAMTDKSEKRDAWDWVHDWDTRFVLGTTEIGLNAYCHVKGQVERTNVGIKPGVVLLPMKQNNCN